MSAPANELREGLEPLSEDSQSRPRLLLATGFGRQKQLWVCLGSGRNPKQPLHECPDAGMRPTELFGLAASILLIWLLAIAGLARNALHAQWCRIGELFRRERQ